MDPTELLSLAFYVATKVTVTLIALGAFVGGIALLMRLAKSESDHHAGEQVERVEAFQWPDRRVGLTPRERKLP